MKFPIFPLNGAVLFTKTPLPLNIFEKRYLEMVDYSLSKNRLIGMIQTKDDGTLYDIGCLGKIVGFNETSDNRYLINLLGKSYFKVISEDPNKYKFRIINANILNVSEIKNKEGILKKFNINLIETYKAYVKNNNIEINIKEIELISDLELRAKFIAIISPFSTHEKQALLEKYEMSGFYETLISILNLYSSGERQTKSIN